MSGTGQKVCVRVRVVGGCKPIIVLSLYQAEQKKVQDECLRMSKAKGFQKV